MLNEREILRCLAESPVYRNLSRAEQRALVEEVLARYGSRRRDSAAAPPWQERDLPALLDSAACKPENR